MKKQKLNNKLSLKKVTVTNLNSGQMNALYGGATEGDTVCTPTICKTVCVTNCVACPNSLRLCNTDIFGTDCCPYTWEC